MPAMPATPHPSSEVEDPHLICGAPPKSLIERGLFRVFSFHYFLKFEVVVCIVNLATPGASLG